jgi:hypothetical protein
MHYAFFLERQLIFLSVFFCFACCNKWLDHIMLVWRETYFTFYLPRTLRFSLLSFQWVFSFSATAFSFCFSPWFLFRSYFIFASRCIWTLVYVGFPQKSCLKKVRIVLEKRKRFMQKSGTKRACLDRGLEFFMPCLIAFW